MSKSSNEKYVKKAFSGKVMSIGLLLLVIGITLIGIGSSSSLSDIYQSPDSLAVVSKKQNDARKKVLMEKVSFGHLNGKAHKENSHANDNAHSGKEHSHAEEGHSKKKHQPTQKTRFWANFLVLFLFITSVGIGSLFLIGLEHVVGANWSVPIRRVTELMAVFILISFIMGLILLFFGGVDALFVEWWDGIDIEDKILNGKRLYLEPKFFTIRFGVAFAFFILFYWKFTSNSKAQDATADQKYTRSSRFWAPLFIMGFALFTTVIAIDWIMTLTPHWFSTMFGVSYFGGSLVAAFSCTIFASVVMKEKGYLHPKMKNDTFYSLGGFLFGFNCFWAYINFCQFMLIWYANIPEETSWYIYRWEGSWIPYTVFLIVFHFVIPLFLLISRSAKTNPKRLKMMAVWLLIAHWIDMYWHVVPTFSKTPTVGLFEVGFMFVGFGLLVVVFHLWAKNANHVAIGDPKLEQGLSFRCH